MLMTLKLRVGRKGLLRTMGRLRVHSQRVGRTQSCQAGRQEMKGREFQNEVGEIHRANHLGPL